MAYSKTLKPEDELPKWLPKLGAYLLHLFLASIGVFFISVFLGAGLEKLNVSETVLDSIFLWGPAFPGAATLGFLVGFGVNRLLRSKSAKWAWIPFVAWGLAGIYVNNPLGPVEGIKYLFGTTCVECADQMFVVMPLVTSIAYSLGAWLALKRNSHRAAAVVPSDEANPRAT